MTTLRTLRIMARATKEPLAFELEANARDIWISYDQGGS